MQGMGHEDSGLMEGTRDRRCIATGEVLPEARLVRFVVDPEGTLMPDVDGRLPGRGYWISADAKSIQRAAMRNLFAKAAKHPVSVPDDLVMRTELGIVQRMLAYLGLARRSGALVLGFDQVEKQIRSPEPPPVILEAREAAEDGRRKLQAAATAAGYVPFVIIALSNEELSLSLGRENVVHAAVKPGRIAERLIFEAARLQGFRRLDPWAWKGFSGA
jgi:predicted RNA-binding protein YlxR (DUF448 family)/ribosomal protein L30E